eukprot:CAMPEP_0201693216 /NCGR_PEP_ID=MMETSP0578-20130828/5867_1 /ASSEMBLY_ACC=CAM_ASM_000663 /TAXON_ID=267565 /ORGANISM="Skeletonema grethea, Strain CCMP 1804" /LENGTH=413 /DNA_ID=CAMNT_0048178703 /DNA_START=113 /DNA_END=1354 /DNA_ORIENTATION=-
MRHRGRNVAEEMSLHRRDNDVSGRAASTQRKKRFHSVLHQLIASVCSFVLFIIVISIPNTEDEQTNANTRGGLNDVNIPPSFVTVVLPSVVNPDNRPLRLDSIAKTWGPASHAVYVVHNSNEYPEGAPIEDGQSHDTTFPQVCLVPETIKFDDGVPRLEYVIRTIHNTIDPDFAFFVNDHTFVLPNHLHQFLKLLDCSKDLYVGHALKGEKETAFNSGASGYVLSRTTMRRLIAEWDKPDSKCSGANVSKWLQGNPGLLTAKCFQEVMGIQLVDTRDKEDGSHKFHAYGLVRTTTGNVDQWYLNKHEHLDSIFGVDGRYHHMPQKGASCCSKDTISFHYVEAAENIAFWNILQTVLQQSDGISDEQIKETMLTQDWPQRPDIGAYSHPLPASQSPIWNDMIQVIRKISSGVTS